MAKYCMYCGEELNDDDRFCYKCGEKVPDIPRAEEDPPVRNAEPPQTRSAGPVWDDSETVIQSGDGIPSESGAVPVENGAYSPETGTAAPVVPFGDIRMPETEEEHFFPDGGGELAVDLAAPSAFPDKGEPSLPAFGPQGWTAGVIGSLFGGLGSLLGGVFKIFTHARALLFTAAISALWIWLDRQRSLGNTGDLVENLGLLTYAFGGDGDTVMQTVGGALGKGVVGAGFCTVLYGGIGKLVRGIKNIFVQPGFNLGAAMIGFSLAAIAYQFTAGFAGEEGFMVGAMGAMMSLEALSLNKGFLVNLSAAFSSRKTGDGGKLLLPGRFKGFLTGAAAGFAGWAALCGTGTSDGWGEGFADMLYSSFDLDLPEGLIPYLVPVLILLVGLIVNAVGKGRKGENA